MKIRCAYWTQQLCNVANTNRVCAVQTKSVRSWCGVQRHDANVTCELKTNMELVRLDTSVVAPSRFWKCCTSCQTPNNNLSQVNLPLDICSKPHELEGTISTQYLSKGDVKTHSKHHMVRSENAKYQVDGIRNLDGWVSSLAQRQLRWMQWSEYDIGLKLTYKISMCMSYEHTVSQTLGLPLISE